MFLCSFLDFLNLGIINLNGTIFYLFQIFHQKINQKETFTL